ncbi:hypothetical protein ROHU_008682 [Labeo rohita]|uniref:Uncharacterized protein n=1 Tax=Labeo rohita TaxID=84645 RepID=A0A498MF53_LABRO|nr:hypothetical protein ROHU_008682 [Labeo rohita]
MVPVLATCIITTFDDVAIPAELGFSYLVNYRSHAHASSDIFVHDSVESRVLNKGDTQNVQSGESPGPGLKTTAVEGLPMVRGGWPALGIVQCDWAYDFVDLALGLECYGDLVVIENACNLTVEPCRKNS